MDEQGTAVEHVIKGFNPATLYAKGFGLGTADLIQGGSFRSVVGRCVSALLLHMRDNEGNRVFQGATIILPPATATSHTAEFVFSALARATQELRGFELDDQEMVIVRRLVLVVNSPSLEVADLREVVHAQGVRRIVAIADASHYRDSSLDLPAVFGVSAIRVGEDRWAPHVHSICRQLVPLVEKLEGYGLIHVREIPAQKPENVELLSSVDDCFVATLNHDPTPEEAINARAPAWRKMVLQDRFTEVVAELKELAMSEAAQLHAVAQLLSGTGRDGEVQDVITALLPHIAALSSEVSVQVAQLAHRAGCDELTRSFLPEGADGVSDQQWLEEGLELATGLEDNDRISRFDARLFELFPKSERLRENRDRRLIMNCQKIKSGDSLVFTTAGFTANHLILQASLSTLQTNYKVVLEEASAWERDWQELASVCCAMHAQSVEEPLKAAEISSLVTSSELYGRQATQVLIWSIKSMMLREFFLKGEHDEYRQLFGSAFRFLALHPEDRGVRSGLTSLLAAETCGDMGIPLIALTMLDLAEQGVGLVHSPVHVTEVIADDYELIRASIEVAMRWLADIGGGEPGVTVIPRDLLVASPDGLLRTITRMVHYISAQTGENVDLRYMQQLVLIACAVCPHASKECDEDIRLMRLLASQFAAAGQFQQARDFAEQILLMGQASLARRRLAWQAFGDVYHHCRNHVVALVGMACALAVDVPVEKADLWHEVYTIHRILRDLGLFDISRSFLSTMKTIMSDLGFEPEKDSRYLSALLSLKLMEADDAAVEPLGELLTEILEACRGALENRNHLVPLVSLLGQSVLKAERAGVIVPPDALTMLESSLKLVGPVTAHMVKTISTAKPRAEDVLTVLNGIQRAAYASDVAHDYAALALTARRLLDVNSQAGLSPEESAFAVELLSDHTVTSEGDAPEMAVEWPVQFASELTRLGLEVAFLALTSDGELTVIHVSEGRVRMVEQPKAMHSFRDRLRSWLQNYPRDYGCVDRRDGNNVFYITMEELDIRLPQCERLVLVAEPFLQQITANLVVMQPDDGAFGYFAGSKSAIGIVPSLSWLSAIRGVERSARTTYRAWISADPTSGFNEAAEAITQAGHDLDLAGQEPTLDIALRNLSLCFEDFGFIVDNGRRLPRGMKDAGVAVVTAHGGLNIEGSYLHSIRDDDGLVVAPSALAAALEGAELVILFVCSGGRIDKNPWDNSTTSLPKQLLNNGTRAVIASPWPLDVVVTYNWLDPFLREWEAGATVLDATKRANDAVARHLGEVPQYSLALRVYGDLMLTKQA